jgi:hypothetical protein
MRAATFGNLCSGTPPILELSPEPRVQLAHLCAIPLPITESMAYHSPVKPRSIGTDSTRPWVAPGATTKTRSASSRSAPLAIAGSRGASARSCGSSTTATSARERACRLPVKLD